TAIPFELQDRPLIWPRTLDEACETWFSAFLKLVGSSTGLEAPLRAPGTKSCSEYWRRPPLAAHCLGSYSTIRKAIPRLLSPRTATSLASDESAPILCAFPWCRLLSAYCSFS